MVEESERQYRWMQTVVVRARKEEYRFDLYTGNILVQLAGMILIDYCWQ